MRFFSFPFADGSRPRRVLFLPVFSTREVQPWGQFWFCAWCTIPVCLCAIHVSVVSRLRVCFQVDLFVFSLLCWTHLEAHGLQRSVIRIVKCWIIGQILTSPTQFRPKITGTSRKTPEMAMMISWSDLFLVFFGVEQRIGGYEKREEKERRRGGLRCGVLSCAVLSCAVYIFCFTSAVRRLWPSTMFFFASCSCFKHFMYINIYIDIYMCFVCVFVFVIVFVFVLVFVIVCVCLWLCCVVCVCVGGGGGRGEVVVVGGWVLCLSLVRLGERSESWFPSQCPSG